MIHSPIPRRDKDDDYAPVDYSYVPSVSEGRRREQLKNIHGEPAQAVVRHRADPYRREAVDAYGTRAPQAQVGRRATVAGTLAPASRIAYPEGTAIPDNPFDPPAETPAKAAAPAPVTTEDGSQFDPPALAQLPEWYRIAQQNTLTTEDRMRRAPRVQAARPQAPEAAQPAATDLLGRPVAKAAQPSENKTPSQLYEEAGYPPALLQRQQELDEVQDVITRRRRHGAQHAVRQAQQEQYERSVGAAPVPDPASYPPPREEYARRRALSDEEREARALAAQRALAANRPTGRGAAYEAAAYQERAYQRQAPSPSSAAYADDGGGDYGDNPYRVEDVPARRPAASGRSAAFQAAAYGGGHGAANPYANAAPSARPAYRRPSDPEADEAEQPARRFAIPWLGIAAFAAAFLAVALWLMQLNFTTQTRQIQQDRRQAAITLQANHPFEYRDLIEREAAKNNLNPAFVAAIVYNESSFRTGAESSVGARGLMQVMEDTAADIGGELGVAGYSFDMLYDAETNVTFGCYYLGRLSERFRGDPILVSAAYHAGATQVQNWLNTSVYSLDGQTLILENMTDGPTKQYATRVKRDFAIYQRLYYDTVEDDA